jgi:hypothetical protein
LNLTASAPTSKWKRGFLEAKALRKAAQMVLGKKGLVQRCRLYKERNVTGAVAPREKQAQAKWRLRGAWSQKDPQTAKKEMKLRTTAISTIHGTCPK